jgi:hypothetical protein
MARAVIATPMPGSAVAASAGGATRRVTRVCSVGVGGTTRASRVFVFPSAPKPVVVVSAWQRSTEHTRELLLRVHLAVH